MASRSYVPPIEWMIDGGSWPIGALRADAPSYARVVRALVRTLREHMDDRGLSMRATAAPAGIDATSLSRLLSGRVVPDVATVCALEEAHRIDLWPGRV